MISFSLSVAADYVIHIGAGSGTEVPTYCATGLDPVILVEADPEAMPHLRHLEMQFPAVQAIQAAVSARTAGLTYSRANFSDLSGLRAPVKALRDLFPGLDILEQTPVAGIRPETLIDDADLPQGQVGLLVLETPGEALGIIDALAETAALEKFAAIRVQEGRAPLYEGGSCIAMLHNRLTELGFACWLEAGPQDPDRPHLLASRCGIGLEAKNSLQTLSAALRESEGFRIQVENELGAVQAQLALKEAQLDGGLAEYKAAAAGIKQLQQESIAARGELEADRDAIRAQLVRHEAEAAELAAANRESSAARAELEADRDAIRAQLVRHEAEAAELAAAQKEALADAADEADRLRAELEQRPVAEELEKRHQAELQSVWDRVEKLTEDARAAQQNLSVALRMQSMREADLKELQQRYGLLLQQKEAQDGLLERLSANLTELPKTAPQARRLEAGAVKGKKRT